MIKKVIVSNEKMFISPHDSRLDEEEEEEILSSSTTGRLWKSSFGRRGIANFLDVCLLKKSYIKALDNMGEDDLDGEANPSVDQDTNDGSETNNDDVSSPSRNGKRSITSPMTTDVDEHQMKRLRSTGETTSVSS